jgi:hypothetical protein
MASNIAGPLYAQVMTDLALRAKGERTIEVEGNPFEEIAEGAVKVALAIVKEVEGMAMVQSDGSVRVL